MYPKYYFDWLEPLVYFGIACLVAAMVAWHNYSTGKLGDKK